MEDRELRMEERPKPHFILHPRSSILVLHYAWTSFACSSIGTAESAPETRQPVLVAAATSWNFLSSMPGTTASQTSWILVILNPSPTLSTVTLAVVVTRCGLNPPPPRPAESAI